MRKQSRNNIFTLSFLDIMSCGFGAVILFFMIVHHANDVYNDNINADRMAEVSLLEHEVLIGEKQKVRLLNTINKVDEKFVDAKGRSDVVRQQLEEISAQLSAFKSSDQGDEAAIEALMEQLRALEKNTDVLREDAESQAEAGEALRAFEGVGDRQYLTGVKVGGERILILVDASASMLDETLVNIIRRRNMSESSKRQAPKWQRAMRTADWVGTRLKPSTQFQIYVFNDSLQAALTDTQGRWLTVGDGSQLNLALDRLRTVIPQHGTSLYEAFASINELQPKPDNIFLITDGLPTYGKSKPFRHRISADQRLKNFDQAIKLIDSTIPINVILFPMEGDPRAAGAYWQLSQLTRGSFMSPAKDWP